MWSRRNAASFASSSANGSIPASRTLPEVGGSSVPRIDNSVLLPEPLGPKMATFSPRRSDSDTPERIRNGSAGAGYSFATLSTTNSAGADSFAISAITSGAGQFAKLHRDFIRNRYRNRRPAVRNSTANAGHRTLRHIAAAVCKREAIGNALRPHAIDSHINLKNFLTARGRMKFARCRNARKRY